MEIYYLVQIMGDSWHIRRIFDDMVEGTVWLSCRDLSQSSARARSRLSHPDALAYDALA